MSLVSIVSLVDLESLYKYMYGSKKFKLLWTIITIIGVFAMLFFTILPAFS